MKHIYRKPVNKFKTYCSSLKENRIINPYSLRVKLTSILTALVFITIFAIWIFNRTFLVDYYLHSKMNTLGKTFDEIGAIYKDNKISETELIQIERICENRNLSIYVITDKFIVEYPPSENSQKILSRIDFLIKNYIFNSKQGAIKSTGNYTIYKSYDQHIGSNYIDLFGTIENGNIVYLRTNLESMQESVVIANKFLAYVGIMSVIIGTLIMFYVSKRFTKPIHQLAGIAKKMSDLDFDIKYDVTAHDEIGELGCSINSLSEKLEKTISELKSANNELLFDIQNKTQIDEMRKDFLSNVSHELKTPIALIQGYAEGLKDNVNEDEESREFYCDVIIDEAKKMNNMVQKLISLNKLEFGSNQVNFERFDIVALIKTVLNSTEILFQQKDVILHFEQYDPIYVWADEYLVEEVLTNYISNALNHVDGEKIIEIKLIQEQDVVRIAVFNTGANIPEEELDKIWIKFYKVDKARTREYGGSGIGLSIVKAIMDSLNRECGVMNRETGVEFWFELDTKMN